MTLTLTYPQVNVDPHVYFGSKSFQPIGLPLTIRSDPYPHVNIDLHVYPQVRVKVRPYPQVDFSSYSYCNKINKVYIYTLYLNSYPEVDIPYPQVSIPYPQVDLSS